MPASKTRQNIRVAVRCRPLNSRELEAGDSGIVYACKDTKLTLKEKSSSRCYTFDRVFGPYSKQTDVYNDMVHPTVNEVLEGYNCTIFAYGQTGTGKTYTMTGERSDSLRYTWENDPTSGIVPRALSQIFSTLDSMGCDFSVRVSFLELYNEELFDLLSISDESVRLAVYDDANKKGSVIVKGLREVAVHDKDEVFGILEKGLQRRQTASTKLNDQSSRSHTVFTVTVHIKEVSPDNDEVFLRIGKLNLVDLAGSENIGRSGALEKRAREAGSINQSLLTLGRVITCLVDHAPHIPYRESKLTRLLQDSLGGKTKTSIIATISPSGACIEETISTLDYAHRAKNIQNKPEINQRLNKNQLVKGYNEELERLRKDLEAARSKTGVYIDSENYQAMTLRLQQQRARIDDLEVRKEILQTDLDSAMRNFELTQQECIEIRETKEKIEADLCRAEEELNLAVENLENTRRRLIEEEYLRSKHQSTEEKLAEQAENLLSVASTYEMDLDGLRKKISRFENLESRNHSAISRLSEVWLPDNLKEPIDLIRTLKMDFSVDFGTLASVLNEVRQQILVSREKNLIDLERVSSNLASVMEVNMKRCVDFTEMVLNDQVRAVKDLQENKLGPILATLAQIGVDVKAQLSAIHERLDSETKSQEQMLGALVQKVISLSNSAGAWKSLFELEMAENVKLRNELNARREVEKTATRALVESVQEVLSRAASLAETRMEWDKKVDESIAANYERIKQVADSEEKILVDASLELVDSISSVNKKQAAAVSSIVNDVENCTTHIASLDCSVKRAGDMLDTMVATTTRIAEDCMTSTNGVGKELRDLSSQWRALAGNGSGIFGDLKSADFFLRTLDDFKVGLVDATKTAIELVVKADATVASAQVRVPVFDELECTLVPRLPNLLSEHLAETIQGYQTTGATPTVKNVPYPKVLTRTGRHSILLSEFRQKQELSQSETPFLDVTNVATQKPLPLTTSGLRPKFRPRSAVGKSFEKSESGQNSGVGGSDTTPGIGGTE